MGANQLINAEKLNQNKIIAWIEIIGGAVFSVYLIGIPFLVLGLRRRKLGKKCKCYASVLLADPQRRISSIASSTGESYGEVVKTLSEINRKGLFSDCCMNEKSDLVSFANDPTGRVPANVMVAAPAGMPHVPVTCSNCNGINKLPVGTVAECEYCGSPLEAPRLENVIESPDQQANPQNEPSGKKKKKVADITLGEAAAAGAAAIGAISIFKD